MPTTRSRENTRARLVEAASEVFAEVGFDGASVEAICERAGFTRGAFYSNFESKEDLFFELARQVSDTKLARVADRVSEMAAVEVPRSTAEIVRFVLDIATDDRLGVLLMSEIRTNAMRDERLARAYLAWDGAMAARVAQIIAEIRRTSRLALRVPDDEAARMLVNTWEDAAVHAAIARLSPKRAEQQCAERIAALASLLVESPAG
ncbi:MAG: TetR/AcrR family transcriptional regulator [Microbacterium sp.]|jgi:AcrR family transcriptional regulator|uniref:HTH-type transcriptional repressor AcnR n=2 Tax=Microbacterium TaxID=33882 RepID=A0A0F0LUZ8_9MICO|nr:TetR/AcrR family transcriptional regulator [Microbacterium ginsengisoli]KJL36150.1 HTH-type transcriptional repressor AcnR [Microbacterium ginsengisoli]MAL06493.1 TetR/AcrR family transcriptional regulator [Microbacterium sp.]HAN25040.1 TetR/AcrR family transcriptional regulator [Microbacterium ginsengisoli]